MAKIVARAERLDRDSFFPLQIGSYFGSEVCPVDVNGDGITDVLLVAAPMYLGPQSKETGRVYIYRIGQVSALCF